MAILNIRNLPDEVHARLRLRAAQNGRSMEAEARHILAEACAEATKRLTVEELQHWIDQSFGPSKPTNVVDEFIAERRQEARREIERYERWAKQVAGRSPRRAPK
jgi:plasmid stability protein